MPRAVYILLTRCSPHNLHLSSSISPLIFFYALDSTICSCNANMDAVFLGSVLHFNHSKSASSYFDGISLCNAFSAKLLVLFPFCLSLNLFFSIFHASFQSMYHPLGRFLHILHQTLQVRPFFSLLLLPLFSAMLVFSSFHFSMPLLSIRL